MNANHRAANWLLGLAGAIAGGIVGFFVFWGLLRWGICALVVPGAALGLAGGALRKDRSRAFGAVCAAFALLLGFFSYWWFRIPRDGEDPGFLYLLTHPNHLPAMILIMIGLGALCGYWFGQGSSREGN
jgi:hypothetical protein